VSTDDSTQWQYFYEIFDGMPRQGPGDGESTRRALALCPPLTEHHRILDIGCGSGTQTFDLAAATAAQIVAVDNHPAFVSQLLERAKAERLEARITAQVGDMTALPYPDQSFDLVWCEGAIFIIGFARGLTEWRRLIAPGRHLVVSELCWLQDNPAAELVDFFAGEGAQVDDIATRRKTIAESGYRLLADFELPARGWWDNYYVPMQPLIEQFRRRHADQPEALAVADHLALEIEMYRRHPGAFGYVFFVMTPHAP